MLVRVQCATIILTGFIAKIIKEDMKHTMEDVTIANAVQPEPVEKRSVSVWLLSSR